MGDENKIDYDNGLDDIYAKMESGDLSVADALKQSNALTAEMTMGVAINAAGKRTEELLLDKDATAAEAQWHKDYPDYDEVVRSGVLQPYIDKSPMLIDETVAYFQWKAGKKFEEGKTGKKPLTESELKGVQTRQEPLSNNELLNSQMDMLRKIRMENHRPTRQEPLSDDELLNSQMDALRKIRGQTYKGDNR